MSLLIVIISCFVVTSGVISFDPAREKEERQIVDYCLTSQYAIDCSCRLVTRHYKYPVNDCYMWASCPPEEGYAMCSPKLGGATKVCLRISCRLNDARARMNYAQYQSDDPDKAYHLTIQAIAFVSIGALAVILGICIGVIVCVAKYWKLQQTRNMYQPQNPDEARALHNPTYGGSVISEGRKTSREPAPTDAQKPMVIPNAAPGKSGWVGWILPFSYMKKLNQSGTRIGGTAPIGIPRPNHLPKSPVYQNIDDMVEQQYQELKARREELQKQKRKGKQTPGLRVKGSKNDGAPEEFEMANLAKSEDSFDDVSLK